MTQKTQINTTIGGNTKTPIRSRKWCGTWNNYNENEYISLKLDFEKRNYNYVIGKEIGNTNNTPHLQFYLRSKSPIKFDTLKKRYPKCHLEVSRGNDEQNLKYCSKDNDFVTNIEVKESFNDKMKRLCLEEYDNVIWKEWQQEILDIIADKPDKRKIHWYWEPKGNTGKSFLCKYICLKYNVIIADGKKDNIFNQVRVSLEQKLLPTIIILDVPRYSSDYTNYGAIEQLKNGLMYSGKYEGGQCIFPTPHVIVLSNSRPEYEKMSKDRWNVKEIIKADKLLWMGYRRLF